MFNWLSTSIKYYSFWIPAIVLSIFCFRQLDKLESKRVELGINIAVAQSKIYSPICSIKNLCNDGWVSPSDGRGRCSQHGGVSHECEIYSRLVNRNADTEYRNSIISLFLLWVFGNFLIVVAAPIIELFVFPSNFNELRKRSEAFPEPETRNSFISARNVTLSLGLISLVFLIVLLQGNKTTQSYSETPAVAPSNTIDANNETMNSLPISSEHISNSSPSLEIPIQKPTTEPILQSAQNNSAEALANESNNLRTSRQLNLEGIRLIKSNETNAAVAALTQAAILEPTNAEVIGNLGYAQYLIGDNHLAIQTLNHALTLKPNRGSTWNNLGLALGAVGQEAEARDSFVNYYNFSSNKLAARNQLYVLTECTPNCDATGNAAIGAIQILRIP